MNINQFRKRLSVWRNAHIQNNLCLMDDNKIGIWEPSNLSNLQPVITDYLATARVEYFRKIDIRWT